MVTSKNKHPLEQVEHTIDILEQVHLDARELFLFDNAPSHKKLVDDALNVDRKNIHTWYHMGWPGSEIGLCRWHTQGMNVILQEKEVDTKGMRAAEMREIKNIHRLPNSKNTFGGLIQNTIAN